MRFWDTYPSVFISDSIGSPLNSTVESCSIKLFVSSLDCNDEDNLVCIIFLESIEEFDSFEPKYSISSKESSKKSASIVMDNRVSFVITKVSMIPLSISPLPKYVPFDITEKIVSQQSHSYTIFPNSDRGYRDDLKRDMEHHN
mmetsp:Transcript_6715/g.12919  ORF Transcript_6715/g.12919 Transcript_6715/m.12919 type:complete len:143 (-) Transcript_6715:21-449(-)